MRIRFPLLLAVLIIIGSSCPLAFSSKEDPPNTLKLGFYLSFKKTFDSSPYALWLETALADVGYKAQIHWLPGRRILSQVSSGALDGDLARSQDVVDASFPHLIRVPTLYGRACYAGYRFEPLLKQLPESQLGTLQIGVFEGLLNVQRLAQEHWPNAQLSTVNDPLKALKMLASGRLNYLLLPPQTKAQLERISGKTLIQSTPHVIQFDTYIFLNPRHASLAPRLAEALQARRPSTIATSCPSP